MKQGEVWLAKLDPTVGAEIRKTRPVVVVSPNELNQKLKTVLVVPLTTGRSFPFRIATTVQGKQGVAAIDQLRAADKRRLVRKITTLRPTTSAKILAALVDMFEP